VQVNIETELNNIKLIIPKCLELADRIKSNIPFHYMYVPLQWWRHFNNTDGTVFSQKRGKNFLGLQSKLKRLFFLTVTENQQLLGAVPLVSYSIRLPSHHKEYHLLTFAGDYVTATCQDFLVDPARRGEIIETILDYVISEFGHNHDIISFGYIADHSENIPCVSQYLKSINHIHFNYMELSTAQRGGVWPWTIEPIKKVCSRILNEIDDESGSYKELNELNEKLYKTVPVKLLFPKTRIELQEKLEAVLPLIKKDNKLYKEYNILHNLINTSVMTYPYIRLPKDRDSYLQTLSKSKRYYFRRYYKKFIESGGGFEKLTSDKITVNDVVECIRLHIMRWGNDSTVICGDSSKEFHKELAIEMAKQNKFTIFFSTLNGKRIAAHTCFDINNRREFYLPGRNPKHEKLRAGSLLLMETILDAIDSGFEIYDFGVVGFDYKMDFTKLTYTTRNFLIYKDYDQPDIDMIYSGFEHRVTVN
jgi:hypothetical protein